ncbi:MAG: sugar-binding protein [Planctomycetota bacterium]
MNRLTRLVPTVLALLVCAGVARADKKDQEIPRLDKQQRERAEALIEQLGDEDFHVRQAATNKLIAMGPAVSRLLSEHKNDNDPEVAWRVSMILKQLPTGAVYHVVRMDKAPKLDGRIDGDEAWNDVVWSSEGFTEVKRQRASRLKTTFAIGFTAEGLYVAVKCSEPNPKKLRAAQKDRGDLFKDDSVELFLHAKGMPTYYQLVFNASGARWNGVGQRPNRNLMPWKVATRIGKDEWTAEVFIPFKMLGSAPTSESEQWRFNVCRNITTLPGATENSAWSPCTGFHQPQKFGRAFFKEVLSKKEAAKALK